MDKISQSRGKLVLNNVFFANLVMSTPYGPSLLNSTAWTDMRRIGYNPDFFELLDVDEIAFVFAHEVAHIALKHGLRRGWRDPDRWNRACDYFINLWLVKAGFKMIKWRPNFPNYKSRKSENFGLYDERFDGMSSEQIYDILEKEDRENGNDGDKDGLHGDVQSPGDLDENERAVIERTINQNVATAANMARMQGKLSADLERIIGELLNPQAPWEDLLREFMTRIVHDDETWVRRNRRFETMYLPTRYSERLGEVISIHDTSGSIDDEQNCKFASEVSYICDNLIPERVRLIWADATVKGEQVFEQGDPFDPKPVGGGGTDMRVPLAHVEQYDPTVVILFTDGLTPWPEAPPPYPLIVCCTTNADVPYGEVVRLR